MVFYILVTVEVVKHVERHLHHIAYAKSLRKKYIYTLLFNIAMENGTFIDDFTMKTSIYKGFSMAMLNNQMAIAYS